MSTYIGRPLPRLEDERLLTGRGRFADDRQLERQAWCVFVRSPHAHARIHSITGGDGALAVLTGADYFADGLQPIDHVPNPLDAHDVRSKSFRDPVERPHWPLARGEVRHVGEPVAAVIAGSAQAARDAAERVAVDYEPLPLSRNLCLDAAFGNPEAVRAAFARAAAVVRLEFRHQRVANAQMEPRSALADRNTLFTGSQGVSRLQQGLEKIFGGGPLRVVTEDVGGAFGPRSYLYPEQVVVLWAARRLGRPVRWTSERSEAFLSDFQGRDSLIQAALALSAEGRILGYEAHVEGDLGAHTVSFVPLANFRNILTTVYDVPAVYVALHGSTSNTVPTSPYRGAGRPEAHHAIERLLDVAARRLSLDPAEIRRRNLVRREQLPYRTPMGLTFEAGDFAQYMERALSIAEYDQFEARRARSRAKGLLRGIGIANYVESPVGAPRERIELTVSAAGVELIAGTQSSGQGHETTFAQVLAERLGVPLERIRLRTGDTQFVSAGGGTHSDRSMRLAGTLIVRGAARIVEQAQQAAASALEVEATDLVYEDGTFRIAGTDRGIPLLELAKAGPLHAVEELGGRLPAYPAGAAVCELEVDPETGSVAVVRYATVDDVGQAVNPMIVDGQTHGGIAQGIGQALAEGVVYDGSGQLLTGSYLDYGLPRASDLPPFACELAEDPARGNPLRIKGGGEGGIVPATAAVINALCSALDVDDVPMPATSQTVWRIICGTRREDP